MTDIDVHEIRKDFPILRVKVHGRPLVYLDSAATSQKPNAVIDTVSEYYRNYNSNIHRGLYTLSEKSTEMYTDSKKLAAKLINAKSYRSLVYCRNTTEAINTVALSWGETNVSRGDTILLTPMEHHSNIVPWQLLSKRKGAALEYVALTEDNNFIDMDNLKERLEKRPKLLAITHESNVLGSINDIKRITRLAHSYGTTVLVDGAQSAPHFPVDVSDLDCDFFVFSSHKMLGPAGIGILYGKEVLLEAMPPVYGGGDMIRSVDFDSSTWNELPWKFEAGTPNIEGGIGFGAAVEYLKGIGLDNVRRHEEALLRHAFDRLAEVKDVKVYGPGKKDIKNRGGIISFNIKGAHPHDVATIFDSEGVAIRAGHHCAMPLVNTILGEGAVARLSFYMYNTEEEIDRAVETIHKVRSVLKIK